MDNKEKMVSLRNYFQREYDESDFEVSYNINFDYEIDTVNWGGGSSELPRGDATWKPETKLWIVDDYKAVITKETKLSSENIIKIVDALKNEFTFTPVLINIDWPNVTLSHPTSNDEPITRWEFDADSFYWNKLDYNSNLISYSILISPKELELKIPYDGQYVTTESNGDCNWWPFSVGVDDLISENKGEVNHPIEDQGIDARAHNHYYKDVRHLDYIDVYRVLELFNVTDPVLSHIAKKVLCAGQRVHKNYQNDLQDIFDSSKRLLEMERENVSKL